MDSERMDDSLCLCHVNQTLKRLSFEKYVAYINIPLTRNVLADLRNRKDVLITDSCDCRIFHGETAFNNGYSPGCCALKHGTKVHTFKVGLRRST